MPNALQSTQGPPDAPQADAQPMQQQGLQAPPQGGPPQQQLQAPPRPTRTQVTAALRHFHAIVDSLKPIANDPDLGKTDLKKKIIDGATELVGQKIITPAQAVQQLQDVPEKPFDQKAWVAQHMAAAMQGANYILDHFRASSPGDGNVMADLGTDHGYKSDDHTSHMAALHDHYKGLIRG
jgi:hypothetical protein